MSSRLGATQNLTSTAAAAASTVTSTATATAKRKLDDLTGSDCPLDDYDHCNRMRKEQFASAAARCHAFPLSSCHHHRCQSSTPSSSSAASAPAAAAECSQKLVSFPGVQFFVRMVSDGGSSRRTLVIHADPSDTVKAIHERIHFLTGIPVKEQGLVYRGKQLDWEKTLAECNIPRDANLELVGRLRSTGHPTGWRSIDSMISQIFNLYKGRSFPSHTVKACLVEFLGNVPHKPELNPQTFTKKPEQNPLTYIEIFLSSSAPAALVMLYMSPLKRNRDCAVDCIKYFMQNVKMFSKKPFYQMFAPIVLEFCKLLSSAVGNDDTLYGTCRSCLGTLVECTGIGGKETKLSKCVIGIQDVFPFVSELAVKLSQNLVSDAESSTSAGPADGDVRDFVAFLHPYRNAIVEQVVSWIAMPFPDEVCRGSDGSGHCNAPCYVDGIKFLHSTFFDLLGKMDLCLEKMEKHLATAEKRKGEHPGLAWCQYLTILKELDSISKMYKGVEELFWLQISQRKVALSNLVLRFAKRDDDNEWISRHKEVLNFEARRHLAMMLLPEIKDDYEDLHEMLIDRSHLLAESFEYIANADPPSLRGGLFMEFKNEEATGPGVLREWFFLVSQEIFNQQNALFVACPNDRRRFFPNSASKVDPMHLDYYKFAGRMIALALMHKIQVGIVFDRVFTLQLAGKDVSLEDIQDADPYLYSSCKQILAMDPDTVDQDVLGLTFIREVEELGSRKIVELCPDGQSIAVNSRNRKQYVDLLIRHRFVTSIADQMGKFAEGFSAVVSNLSTATSFFQSLDPEDLNWMLHGSESAISVEDWKAHTEYNGYKRNDPQILWFWKVVGKMSAEQKKVLLFFWTSIKHLPMEGFGGLASRLYIYKTPESHDRLPSSHTCFFRLCFPPYDSKSVMQDRLSVITQEHVGCSFGTW